MSVLDPKKTYKNLKKKGFFDMETKSNDHKYIELVVDDMPILHTKISHGSKNEIGNHLIGQMAKQCKLDKNDFLDLAKCPMKKETYIEILKKDGWIDKGDESEN